MNRREGGEGVRTHMDYRVDFEKIAERREAEMKRAAAKSLIDTALAWMGMTVAAPMAAAGLGAAGLAGAGAAGAQFNGHFEFRVKFKVWGQLQY